MEQDQENTATSYEQLVAEVAKAKADHNYKPVLPANVVIDAEFPDGFYFVRPCLEEFVSHNYPAEKYDEFFGGESVAVAGRKAWGPGWSNPNWVEPGAVPLLLVVRSQVRRVGTRTARATSSTRHRFKQYLFNDQSHRLVRNGARTVLASKVLTHIDDLIKKEVAGMLTVHMLDGRKVNLQAMRAGVLDIEAAPLPAPQPNPPLDSIANDTPSGNPMPQFIEGSFPGDPTAEDTLKRMLADKRSEQGVEEEDPLFVDFSKSIEEDSAGDTEVVGDADAAKVEETVKEPPAEEEETKVAEESAIEASEAAPAGTDEVTEPAAKVEEISEAPASSTQTGKSVKKGNKR